MYVYDIHTHFQDAAIQRARVVAHGRGMGVAEHFDVSEAKATAGKTFASTYMYICLNSNPNPNFHV